MTAASVAALGADAASPADRSAATTTLRYTLRAAPDRDESAIDSPPAGPSLGDEFMVADRIYDRGGRRRLGRSNGYCVATGLEHHDNQCSGTFYLPGGRIEWVAGDDGPPRLGLEIVGGFGRYAGARGTATIEAVDPSANRSRLVIQLAP